MKASTLYAFTALALLAGCATSFRHHPRLAGLDPAYDSARAEAELKRVLGESFEVRTGQRQAPTVRVETGAIHARFAGARAGWGERECSIPLDAKQDFVAIDRGNDLRAANANARRYVVVAATEGTTPVCDVGFAEESPARDLANALFALQRRTVTPEAIAVATNPAPAGFAEIPGRVSVLRGEEKWRVAPPPYPSRTQLALLEGDLDRASPFTARVLLSSQAEVKPYSVLTAEKMTVLTGSVWVGFGDKPSRSTARRYDAGAFLLTPPGVLHALWTEAEGALVQISAEGPWKPVHPKK